MFNSLTVLSLLLTGSVIHADPIRGLASTTTSFDGQDIGMHAGDYQAVITGSSLSQRDILFRTLLSTQGKDLDWPGFPRTWHEQYDSETLTTNTQLGFIPFGPVSTSVYLDYKYTLKTSMVIIAANKAEGAAMDNHQVTIEPANNPLELEIFKWDALTRQAMPNVRKDYPMVAFCAFEASMSYSTGGKFGVQFFGSGELATSDHTRGLSQTIYSRFFQVTGDMSPLQILDNICIRRFRPQVQTYVGRDFSRTVVELMANYSTDNDCMPSALDNDKGDADCMDWFKKADDDAKQFTIPRCVINHQGVHRCKLTAKLNGNCGMSWDIKNKQAVANSRIVAGYFPRVTGSPYEFDCDPKQNMSCQMVSQPVMAWYVPIWNGAARCLPNR